MRLGWYGWHRLGYESAKRINIRWVFLVAYSIRFSPRVSHSWNGNLLERWACFAGLSTCICANISCAGDAPKKFASHSCLWIDWIEDTNFIFKLFITMKCHPFWLLYKLLCTMAFNLWIEWSLLVIINNAHTHTHGHANTCARAHTHIQRHVGTHASHSTRQTEFHAFPE